MHAISLPMYDLPFLRAATRAWATGLARALKREGIVEAVPVTAGDAGVDGLWRSDDLLLSQTCGYPLMTEFAGDLALLATPLYRAAGSAGSNYVSFIIVRDDAAARSLADLRGLTCTINGWQSHSGMNALRHTVSPLARDGRFFGDIILSGSHLNSIAMVAAGDVDVAAVDCVTHALAARHAPALIAGVRVLATTRAAPALPYVTRANAAPDLQARVAAGLRRAAVDSDLTAARNDLLLAGFEDVPLAAYSIMTEMESEAAVLGYPVLA